MILYNLEKYYLFRLFFQFNLLFYCLFSFLFDIRVPEVLAELVDNPLGKIVLAALSLCLLSANTLAGVIGLVAAYVLIQRSPKNWHSRKKTLCSH